MSQLARQALPREVRGIATGPLPRPPGGRPGRRTGRSLPTQVPCAARRGARCVKRHERARSGGSGRGIHCRNPTSAPPGAGSPAGPSTRDYEARSLVLSHDDGEKAARWRKADRTLSIESKSWREWVPAPKVIKGTWSHKCFPFPSTRCTCVRQSSVCSRVFVRASVFVRPVRADQAAVRRGALSFFFPV